MESKKRPVERDFIGQLDNNARVDDDDDDEAVIDVAPLNYYYYNERNNNNNIININININPTIAYSDDQLIWMVDDRINNYFGYKDVSDLKIIYDRKLTDCDVNRIQARLAILKPQIKTPFLTSSEEALVSTKKFVKDKKTGNFKNKGNLDIPLELIFGFTKYHVSLTRWDYGDSSKNKKKNEDNKHDDCDNNNDYNDKKRRRIRSVSMKKKGDKVGWKYALKHGWKTVWEQNGLKRGDNIRLVSFRSRGDLRFAMVKQRTTTVFGAKLSGWVLSDH